VQGREYEKEVNRDLEKIKGSIEAASSLQITDENPKKDSDKDIINIMNALFYPRDAKSYETINKYVDFSEALKTEAKKAMSISERNYQYGLEDKESEIILNMHKKGLKTEEISDYLQVNIEKVEEIINSQTVLA
jgi:predicted transposase YdaD